MHYLPSSRRYLFPALILLSVVFLLRIFTRRSPSSPGALIDILLGSEIQHAIEVPQQYLNQIITPAQNSSNRYITQEQNHYYTYRAVTERPSQNPHLAPLWTCSTRPNPYTNHIRLSSIVQNISNTPPEAAHRDSPKLFNPTIIALPYWSENPYLLVSRVVTKGFHQESVICEARVCFRPSNTSRAENPGDRPCGVEDLELLGPIGGLRCNKPPQLLRIPPTPAERCVGSWASFPDIPGFHDPRIFWSGRGEPLIIVNSASAYGCVGLWVIDLRAVYTPLNEIIGRGGDMHASAGQGKRGEGREGPLMSYPHLTELTRNPRSDRVAVEKNWLLFYPKPDEAFLNYDMTASHNGSGRSFAKLIGNGFSTPNLTDADEKPCLGNGVDASGEKGHWHQASNALKLVLCTRDEAKRRKCGEQEGKMVHFAIMHRKFSNDWHLPLRYERYIVVWAARPPFELMAVSRFPLLFRNETASGWSGEQNWVLDHEVEEVQNLTGEIKGRASQTYPMMWNNTKTQARRKNTNWAYFTYSTSIAWAWRPRQAHSLKEGQGKDDYFQTLNVGYLDDDIIVGIGLEDTAQAFARAKARELLQCMRACPGIVRVVGGAH